MFNRWIAAGRRWTESLSNDGGAQRTAFRIVPYLSLSGKQDESDMDYIATSMIVVYLVAVTLLGSLLAVRARSSSDWEAVPPSSI